MKRSIWIFAALALLGAGVASCDKDTDEETPTPSGGSTDTPVVAPFDENGASTALFSVSETKQVRFSKGNLQYQPSTGTWRFADQQNGFIGDDNVFIASTYTGWIDLFCWGTSGWESGANNYQPYSSSTNNADFFPGGSSSSDLTGEYANADWGVYNAIINGGNAAGMWRTLTNAEWDYLLDGRPHAHGRRGAARVDGVPGMVILPDLWTVPDGLTFKTRFDGWDLSSFTLEEWSRMEQAGAIFLPASGSRHGDAVMEVGNYGVYWSVTHKDASEAYGVYFNSGYGGAGSPNSRSYGRSVRLVCE